MCEILNCQIDKYKLEDITMDEKSKLWTIMAILLTISSIFGFAAFLVGRAAYGKTIGED